MRVDLAKFSELYQKLFEIDYFGSIPGICANLASVASIRAATAKGAPFLPMIYHEHYFGQVDARLPDVMSKLKQQVASGERPAELAWAGTVPSTFGGTPPGIGAGRDSRAPPRPACGWGPLWE